MTKLTITPLKRTRGDEPKLEPLMNQAVEVLFNPNSYSITKPVNWKSPNSSPGTDPQKGTEPDRKLNAPKLEFGGGGSRVLTLELFFDVTEPVNGEPVDDVRKETSKIVKLTRIQPSKGQVEPPPVCEVSWGKFYPEGSDFDFPFTGVITNLVQRFTLFKRDGTPVRANLTVTFTEFLVPQTDKKKTDPELTTHVVMRGDTLSSIAAQVYRDPTIWRTIAEANRLDDPRHLKIGQSLTIPSLR